MPVLSVRQVLDAVETVIQRRWPTPVEVEGELAQVTVAGSGHAYLTLRDAVPGPNRITATLAAVCWRSTWARMRARPAQGDRVVIRGKLGVYAGRGSVQLTVLDISPAGEGALARQIAERRARLEADGLLDPRRKRPLPEFPAVVGVATSLTGAALQDFLKVSGARFPATRILVAGCLVQGDAAPASVVQAMELLLDEGRAEVIVVTRGGGSRDDLLAFQDEGLARFVAHCPVPVVSAVGHQVDETLCDLVADAVVATPTEAAVRVLPDGPAWRQRVDDLDLRLGRAMQQEVAAGRRRVAQAQARLRHPAERLAARRQALDRLEARLAVAARRTVAAARRRLVTVAPRLATATARRLPEARMRLVRASGALAPAAARLVRQRRHAVDAAVATLSALGPQRVLDRGYALVTGPDGLVADPSQAPAGTALTLRVRGGAIGAVSTGPGEAG